MLRAVLFDLDDTLFDHDACARSALEGVQAAHAGLHAIPFADFERAHSQFLEEMHREVLAGRMALDDARRERFRRVLLSAGIDPDPSLTHAVAESYRTSYQSGRRAVAGAAALLARVKASARVGVVTNNLREEQEDKLRVCGLHQLVDALIASEEVGISKPDPGIFHIALDRLGAGPEEAVMIGDSWSADILGAQAVGIRAIWFNPHGAAPPDPSVAVLRSLEPTDAALQVIIDAHRD